MTDEPVILAISVDFQRLEAALVDTNGVILHIEGAPLRALPKVSLHHYLDPASLVDTFARTVNTLLERKPREARRIAGVGLIGRSPSVAPVTSAGPQAAFLLPGDARLKGKEHSPIPWKRVYELAGLTAQRCEIPFVIDTHEKEKSAVFLTPKDFVKWSLTGAFSTDPLDAQRTFLWDLEKRAWSDELIAIFGANRAQLPEILPPMAVAGRVTAGAATATGIRAGLPVACGMGDWGEYLGTGAFEEGDAFEHIGATGAFYGVTSKRPAAALGLEVRPHALEGRYLTGREGLPGGACLEWLLKKTYLSHNGEIDWQEVDEELEAVAAMSKPENVLFFPALADGHGQINNAAYLNLRIDDDLTGLLQATTEGLFFTLKAVCEELKSTGWTPKAVFTTGQIGFKHAPRRTRANIYGLRIFGGRQARRERIERRGSRGDGGGRVQDDGRGAQRDARHRRRGSAGRERGTPLRGALRVVAGDEGFSGDGEVGAPAAPVRKWCEPAETGG